MRIFAVVPRGGVVKRQFSAFSLAISFEMLEIRPALLHSDTQFVVGFPKCMNLNDLDWLFRHFRVKFCFRAGLAGSGSSIFEKIIA